MLMNIVIGCGLIVITTCLHATAMVFALRVLKLAHAKRWAGKTQLTKAAAVSVLVVIMFVAGLLGSAVWAGAYLALGAFTDVETAAYFSAVTYTTLGFGDVVMDGRWRLLSAIEAANGIIIFGWTTALIVAAVHRLYLNEVEVEHAGSSREQHDV